MLLSTVMVFDQPGMGNFIQYRKRQGRLKISQFSQERLNQKGTNWFIKKETCLTAYSISDNKSGSKPFRYSYF